MRAGEAEHEVGERGLGGLGEGGGQAEREGHPEGVAQAPGVLGRREPRLVGDGHLDGPTRGHQLGEPGRDLLGPGLAPQLDLGP